MPKNTNVTNKTFKTIKNKELESSRMKTVENKLNTQNKCQLVRNRMLFSAISQKKLCISIFIYLLKHLALTFLNM